MSEFSPVSVPAFIGPRAAEVAFCGGFILDVNVTAINEIIHTTADFDKSFCRLNSADTDIVTAGELALVIRGHNPQKPHPWDFAWHRERLGAYYPIDQLARTEMRDMQAVTRSEIAESGKYVVELKVTDFAASIGVILAAVLVGVQTKWYSRQERSLSAATTGDPLLAQRQIRAMNAVEDLNLEPFTVTRKPGYENCASAAERQI